MRRSGLILSRKFVIGILIWIALLTPLEALRGSAVVLQSKTKAAEQKEGDEENAPAANVTKPQLTGIPQIDYLLDPNLPRELNGHNLTDYPFYNSVPDPDEIDFKCDGLHDGFYASVPHKCQVYHHCLFGTRYDFLCANYTAFDQKTFICQFVSEVDCDNSPKYYKRNEALYKEASTTTTSTTTTTTTPSTTTTNAPNGGRHGGNGPRRRRPYRRRRPMYEYYYDDEEYADGDYYDDEVSSLSHRRTPYRKHNKENYPAETRDPDADYDSQSEQAKPPAVRPSTSGSSSSSSVYERPRTPPKVRRPVPKNERDKYDYTSKQATPTPAASTTTTEKPIAGKAKQPVDEEYYEDEEEYDYEEPKAAAKPKHHVDYDFPTGFEDTRRYMSRYRGRVPARKRAEMYDDYDIKERPSRINRRKEYTRYDNERPRNARPMHRPKNSRHEDHAPMPTTHKKRPEPEYRTGNRRAQEPKRPAEDEYYYEEEEEQQPEEAPPKRNRRPNVKVYDKAKSPTKPSSQSKERVQDDYERPSEPAPKYGKGSTSTQRNPKVNTLENEVPKVSPAYNEISTTEINLKSTSNQNQKYPNTVKAVKIVTNSLKEEPDENVDSYAHTEAETKMSSTQMKPVSETPPAPKYSQVVSLKTLSPQNHRNSESYAPESPRRDKKPIEYDDRPANKTITPVRHFVVSSPRKPSHYAQPSSPVNYRDDSPPYRSEEKPHKLPEPVQKPAINSEYYKPMQYAPQNVSLYPYRPFSVPVSNEPKHNTRPVKEEHLVPETLNTITNNNYFSTGFISEPKPFTNDQTKSTSSNTQQNYRHEPRLYTNGDRLYTTNSISFPPHPPANYDITAPGPSAPGEEPTAPEKKYSDPPTYTASADYDVTYNDALQPSTLHPIRRYPSTSFYSNQQQRSIPSRLPSDYAFNEGAYNSLGRSQTRYK